MEVLILLFMSHLPNFLAIKKEEAELLLPLSILNSSEWEGIQYVKTLILGLIFLLTI